MNKIVGETQTTFIPGRNIYKNILITHEACHFLNKKMKSKVAYASINADIN